MRFAQRLTLTVLLFSLAVSDIARSLAAPANEYAPTK
jgi:hypothetical protein